MRAARAWIRSLATLAGLTLLIAGCLKLDMALTIAPDDTVDGELVFAVNKELLELTGQDVDDILGDTAVPSDVEGATQEPYEDDRFVGTRVVFEDVTLDDLQERSDPDSLSIVRHDDTYEVSGVMDLATEDAELEGNPFEDQITEAFDTAELRIAITFPGEVIETNGQVDGTTVTWEPVFGKRTELTAVASVSGDVAGSDDEGSAATASDESSGGNTLLFVILGVAIIGALIAWFVVKRRREDDAPGGSGVGAPIPMGTDPAMPAAAPGEPTPTPTPAPTPAPTPPPPPPADPPGGGPGG